MFQYFWKFTGQMDNLEGFGGGGCDESPRWGHSPRMRSGGSGDEGSLPNSFGWELILFIKTQFYGGALTSHFLEEHSSITSMFPVFMMTSSNGNMFRVTGFCAGNSPVTAGNSPVPGEFPSHRPVTWSFDVSLICAWTNGSVNNQDAGDLRRHRAHYDVAVMWCWIVIQWSGQQWDLSAFNAASLLSNFELVKRFKLGGSVHYGRNGLKFGTLLYPDYHSLKLTIFCTQRHFKFVVSSIN